MSGQVALVEIGVDADQFGHAVAHGGRLVFIGLGQFDVAGLNGQRAPLGHGVARVHREVHEHLLDLLGTEDVRVVALRKPGIGAETEARYPQIDWREVELLDREAVRRAIGEIGLDFHWGR